MSDLTVDHGMTSIFCGQALESLDALQSMLTATLTEPVHDGAWATRAAARLFESGRIEQHIVSALGAVAAIDTEITLPTTFSPDPAAGSIEQLLCDYIAHVHDWQLALYASAERMRASALAAEPGDLSDEALARMLNSWTAPS